MAKDLFSTLDLNLLRTFLIVYQEKNTRKAAERLFVSQPAVSQALQKLRHHFNDDLFVKVHGGLQATSFSEQLINEITPHFDGLMTADDNPYTFQDFQTFKKFCSKMGVKTAHFDRFKNDQLRSQSVIIQPEKPQSILQLVK